MRIEGVSELLELQPMPVHVQADEAEYVLKVTDLERADLVEHRSGDTVTVGAVRMSSCCTPRVTRPEASASWSRTGWSPATPCSSRGADAPTCPAAIPRRCTRASPRRLARVPDSAVLFPGHLYSPKPSEQMGEVRRSNMVFKPRSAAEWMRVFGS